MNKGSFEAKRSIDERVGEQYIHNYYRFEDARKEDKIKPYNKRNPYRYALIAWLREQAKKLPYFDADMVQEAQYIVSLPKIYDER